MRRIAAIVLAAACLWPSAARAQDEYAAVLLQYLTGDADAALTRLAALSYPEIRAGIDAFDVTRSRQILTGAAAMHTEAALRRGGGLASEYHLQMATAIVEFGERTGGKSNVPVKISPKYAVPVSAEFRRLWDRAIINALETSAMVSRADKYLARAMALFPDSPELHLLAGVDAEMHASPRMSGGSAGDRRHGLDEAEKHYRAVVAKEPDRLEARLRLARVLQERDKTADARPLLQPLTRAEDDRIAYLAALFLGGIEERDRHDNEAAALYEQAAARMPLTQTALLAASELRHRRGDCQWAADAIAAAAGPRNEFDPWWTYIFGEYWRGDLLLAAIRGKRHA